MLSELALIHRVISRWPRKVHMELPERAQRRTMKMVKRQERMMYD